MINAIELVELLQQGKNDAEIAKYFGCHPTVIARLRRTMMSVKPTITAPPKKAKDDEPPTKDYVSLRSLVNCMDGSQTLLLRQFETGMHWLDKPRFLAVVREMGWQDKLPKGLIG